jgi:hypothetical protein
MSKNAMGASTPRSSRRISPTRRAVPCVMWARRSGCRSTRWTDWRGGWSPRRRPSRCASRSCAASCPTGRTNPSRPRPATPRRLAPTGAGGTAGRSRLGTPGAASSERAPLTGRPNGVHWERQHKSAPATVGAVPGPASRTRLLASISIARWRLSALLLVGFGVVGETVLERLSDHILTTSDDGRGGRRARGGRRLGTPKTAPAQG